MKTCLFLSQELSPHFSEGGLGLTSAGLTAALQRDHGWDHVLVIPFYPFLVSKSKCKVQHVGTLPTISRAGNIFRPMVFELADHGHPCRVLLVRSDEWYDRGGIYRGANYEKFEDAGERAIFYGLCILEIVRSGLLTVDIVHGNDWQSGAALFFLRQFACGCGGNRPMLLFNVHNAGHRGVVEERAVRRFSGYDEYVHSLARCFEGRVSLLEAGILAADRLVTGSPSYANELVRDLKSSTLSLGGLDLQVEGIVAGIDTELWGPECAPERELRYTSGDLIPGKNRNKKSLNQKIGLSGGSDEPLFCVCGRLVEEKGIDLILSGTSDIFESGKARLAVMGKGVKAYVEGFRRLEKQAEGFVAYIPEYSIDAARSLYAASDFALMPSRVEPCGLNQLIAMRYGTLPIVSAVGGLKDTVIDYSRDPKNGTGFVLSEVSASSLRTMVLFLINWFRHKGDQFEQAVGNAIRRDWSWNRVAVRFAQVYEESLTPSRRREDERDYFQH